VETIDGYLCDCLFLVQVCEFFGIVLRGLYS
jgi:hypothetical protein